MPHQSRMRALVIGVVAALALAHAVADDLAAAEFYFVAVVGVVFFYLDPQLGIAEANPIAHGGAVHIGIRLSGNFHALPSSLPITSWRKP